MEAEITKIFRFEAAHNLVYHNGKCRNLHGHSYRAEVTVSGEVKAVTPFDSESGMVVDFNVLSAIWDADLDPLLDHSPHGYLNEIMLDESGQLMYPTAEHLARWIFEGFVQGLERRMITDVQVISVKLWETESSYVVVR